MPEPRGGFAPDSKEFGYEIFVQLLTGRCVVLGVNYSISIAEAKAMLYKMLAIPIDQQRLIYCGREMKDDRRLSDYLVQRYI